MGRRGPSVPCSWAAVALIVVSTSSASAASKRIEAAERAQSLSDYEEARRQIEMALVGEALSDAERVVAHRLLAEQHVAYGEPDAAQDEYVKVLDLDPAWRPAQDASPKILSAFAAAKAAFDARTTEPDATIETGTSADEVVSAQAVESSGGPVTATEHAEVGPAPAWYRQSWIWIAAGTVALVGGGVAYALTRSEPDLPTSDYFVRLPRPPK